MVDLSATQPTGLRATPQERGTHPGAQLLIRVRAHVPERDRLAAVGLGAPLRRRIVVGITVAHRARWRPGRDPDQRRIEALGKRGDQAYAPVRDRTCIGAQVKIAAPTT
jgi:hypothetical protein